MCADCSNILEGNVIKIAAKLNIPLVVFGLSPEQSNRYFYEVPKIHLDENWALLDYRNLKNFKELDNHYSWNGETTSIDNLKVILPFHIWDYDESEKEIQSKYLNDFKVLKVSSIYDKEYIKTRIISEYNGIFKAIIPCFEGVMEIVAWLRRELNIAGEFEETIIKYRNKVLMKDIISSNKIS